jgi:DNA ligase (NAD+)
VSDPADLYTLTVEQIENITLDGGVRIGTSRATEIVKNIAGKKILPLHTLLGSLGIDLLGRRRVQLLQKQGLTTITDWLDDAKVASIQIPGLGETIREAIRNGINENRALLQKLAALGVNTAPDTAATPVVDEETGEEVATPQLPFSGLSFCLTGTRAFIDDIERLGGTVKSGVSKGLTYLVQKDPLSQSTKTKKADEYGTKIISLDYLEKAINGEVSLQ